MQPGIRIRGLLPGWLRAAIRVDAEVQIAAMAGAEFFFGRRADDGTAGRQGAAVAGRIGDFTRRARRDDRTRQYADRRRGSVRERGRHNSCDRTQPRRMMSDSMHTTLHSGEDAAP
jgi:hypothetical protein